MSKAVRKSPGAKGAGARGAGGRGRRGAAERHRELLASAGWHAALEQFARATGLGITLLDAGGRPHAGPFAPTPLAARLVAAGGWEASGGQCLKAGARAAREALKTGATAHGACLDLLALFAVPTALEGQAFGAVVAGWVFDNFPDPVAIDLLSRKLNVAFAELWQIARQQPPISREKLSTYAELLRTFNEAFLREHTEFLHEQETSRELQVLNESGQRLTAAASVAEVGEAVVEAATRLLRTPRARLLVPDDEGRWQVAAARGFPEEGAGWPGAAPAGRGVTRSLRIPVEHAGGHLLGLIETADGGAGAASQAHAVALASQAAVALQKVRTIADLERQRAELSHANRMKDEFLAVLSHELRTPLTPILGWATMLRQGQFRDDEKALETALAAIERNARQELHLVEEMLDLSRILNDKIEIEPVPTDPHDAVASALAAAQTFASARQLHLKVDAEQNLPHVLADPQRLAQVFANLVSNAVKFTPDGGTVSVGARRDGDGWVEFFVRDTGAGIRPEVVPHIFERFRQGDSSTTRRYGGLGIGLSVVRGLVELHGGRVRAESDGEGQGAAFIFRLPAADAPAAGSGARAGAERGGRAGGPRRRASKRGAARVLLVDDSLDTLAVVGRMLEAAGYAVTTAASPGEALEHAGRATFDCVITDIGMPETDGFWLLERLRADEATARLPAVALTGFVSPFDRESILAAGFRAHLAKPIEQRALIAALEGILAERTL